jgi:hypothetical protein
MSLIDVVTRPIAEALGLVEEPPVRWCYHRSSALPQNRHNLVREAQKMGVSHILFLDDDMTFPPDTLERMLRAGKPIVAANCTTRALPIVTTAIKNEKRITSLGKTGLEYVDQVGMAVMLIDMKVFDRVPLPWFSFAWDAEYPDTYCSEDMFFCKKARAEGIPIVVDHELSQQIGHVGELEYRHDMVDEAELAEVNARADPTKHIKVT